MRITIRLTVATFDEIYNALQARGFFGKAATTSRAPSSSIMKIGPVYFIRGT